MLPLLRRLLPFRIAAPGAMMRAHVGAVTHAKQHGAARAVLVLVHLTRRMHDEGAGLNGDSLLRRAHGAAAGKAEIDFGGVRVAVVGADLPGLPAGDRDVAIGDLAQDLFHVVLGIPLLLALEAKNMYTRCSS